jgi:SAM-dependent methyltransferase
MSISVFDNIAAAYDAEFTNSKIGLLQRQCVYQFLFPLLNKNTKLLEINCGTGHDAMQLAPKVNSILATDISESMIEVAEEKKKKLNLSNLHFKVLDIKDIQNQLSGKYDLIFSNFGGLNCLSKVELIAFTNSIFPFIEQQGKLVLVVMPKKCFIENLWFLLKRDKRIYRRDTTIGLQTHINGSEFFTYYYSPSQIKKIFSSTFKVKKIRPIGLFIPPSYLNSFFENKKILLKCLSLLENIFGNLSIFANYADHCYIELEKK